ncbi:MAG TPA: hypothetical protein VES36_04070, partial [Candidatus Limnocylindrales bacterium]|nr:hypothetical protein [Candidatus Limnocylindrales bacterium]
ANDHNWSQSISADGRFVAFGSRATNLVPGDTNGQYDVFVHDRETGKTERVENDGAGQVQNQVPSTSISADGRFVAFHSSATNLAPGDTNGAIDTFVYDRETGKTERVSIDSAGNQGSSESGAPSISADGRHVTWVWLLCDDEKIPVNRQV